MVHSDRPNHAYLNAIDAKIATDRLQEFQKVCFLELLRQTIIQNLITNGQDQDVRHEVTVGNSIDSGMGLSITIDKLRVFINKTLSILSVYQ